MTSSTQQIVALGFLSNILLAAAKFLAGWVFNSNSLTCDGWHSITDLAMDVVTAVTLCLSSKPMQNKLGRATGVIESFGAFFISSMMLAGAAQSAWRSGNDFQAWIGSRETGIMSDQKVDIQALWVPIMTIIIKEWLYATSK